MQIQYNYANPIIQIEHFQDLLLLRLRGFSGLTGLINLLHRLKGFLRMDGEHVAIKVHRAICHVITQFAQELQLVRVLLKAAVHYLFVVHILHVAVQVGSA